MMVLLLKKRRLKACDKWGKRVSESTMAAEKYDRVGDGGVWVGSGADSTET